MNDEVLNLSMCSVRSNRLQHLYSVDIKVTSLIQMKYLYLTQIWLKISPRRLTRFFLTSYNSRMYRLTVKLPICLIMQAPIAWLNSHARARTFFCTSIGHKSPHEALHSSSYKSSRSSFSPFIRHEPPLCRHSSLRPRWTSGVDNGRIG